MCKIVSRRLCELAMRPEGARRWDSRNFLEHKIKMFFGIFWHNFFVIYSRHGDGGHYHYDTTPDEVEYIGYFNLAEGNLFLIKFSFMP